MTIPQYMKPIVEDYYKNDGRKIRNMVDTVLKKLKFDVDHEDFYSLSNEIFVKIIKAENYDPNKDFDGFFYSCLCNKFKTEMTRRKRYKRKADDMAISIDSTIDENESVSIKDIIADKRTVESIYFGEREKYSVKMNAYLSRLSPLQKKVLKMKSLGYEPREVMVELKLTQRQYDDCNCAIHSYSNTRILM